MERATPTPRTPRALVAAAVVAAIGLATFFALAGRGGVLLYGDEFHSFRKLDGSWSELVRLYDSKGSGVALLLLQRLAIDLFGLSVWSLRLPATLGAIAAVAVCFPVARRLIGPTAAAIATLALATNSTHIYYSGVGRAYAPLVLFALLVVHAFVRSVETDRLRWHVALALCTGLLVFLHLTTLAFAGALGLASPWVFARLKAQRKHLLRVLASLVAGLLLAVLLHLPAWSSLLAFARDRSGGGAGNPIGVLDVALVLVGSSYATWLFLIAAPLGAIGLLRRGNAFAPVVVALSLLPVLGLVVTRPNGMSFAYARYLVDALPFLAMLAAWCVHGLLLRIVRRPSLAFLGAMLAVCGVPFLLGPRGPARTEDAAFANGETSLALLPVLDVPWDRAPAIYAQLAGDTSVRTVLEVPELPIRAGFLYRNHYLRHGKEVRIGSLFERVDLEPYVWLPGSVPDDLGADYLLLHMNLEQEIFDYWTFLTETRDPDEPLRNLLMDALSQPGHVRDQVPSLLEIAGELEQQLGPPAYRSRYVLAWDLRAITNGGRPLELDPRPRTRAGLEQADEWNDKATNLARAGRLNRAIVLFERSLELVPDHAQTLSNYASALAATGRRRESNGAFVRSLELNPYAPETHFNYALLLLDLRREGPAREHLDTAVELDPSMKDAALEALSR